MKQLKTQLHNTLANNRLNLNECEELNPTDDIRTEEMLQSAAQKPLSQLLDKIAQLPEVRYEKITTVRRQISMGEYQIDDKLDATIDRLLEELIVEP
jgi:anti-sigma28 factor (negative regulator of flagellin synthesis)